MENLADLHNHSEFSYDSQRSMENIVEEAVNKGIAVLGFSDHLDFNEDDPGNKYYNPEKQFKEFHRLEKKFKSQIRLVIGIESSYERNYADKIYSVFNAHPFEYRIMSVHFIDGVVISDWLEKIEKNEDKIENVDYSKYFDALEMIAEEGEFDILGHLDYYKKYSKFNHVSSEERYKKRYELVFKTLARRKKIIEINTSGLRHRCREQFPSKRLLEMYKNIGGKMVSTGSDSHNIGDTGFEFKKIYELADNVGLKVYKADGRIYD